MSHLTQIQVVIDDLDALQAACLELGCQLVRGQKTFTWYGRSVGDYPLPAGFTAADLGHCDHVIRVPGSGYEIGVCKNKQGRGYTLLYDFYGSGRGEVITEKLGGEKLPKLVQAYGINRATMAAKKLGHTVQRVAGKNGAVNLVITGRGL